jgi:hypothetical protein
MSSQQRGNVGGVGKIVGAVAGGVVGSNDTGILVASGVRTSWTEHFSSSHRRELS